MKLTPGTPNPLGLSVKGDTSNFALFSSHATQVILGLFSQSADPIKEIPLYRTGDIWHIGIEELPNGLHYAYRCEGPPELLYNPKAWLIDPYAKIVLNQKALAAFPATFDWQNDRLPKTPLSNTIIYEMHVRGFTKHPSSGVSHPGTYLGIIEKIPYLKKLGVTALELMPIFGFAQKVTKYMLPNLVNYWGYDPLHFFAPMDLYAAADPILEFKTLVRELHKAGIEVILDVVYNHTGEMDWTDYYVNFRGIDNSVYYMLDPNGKYLNYTGCGNTLNANHPIVKDFILDSLRYWAEEMHVDGFRFDLASILTRDISGHPTKNPPLLEAIRKDPILNKLKLIAEAWDAVGLYQVGSFPKWGPWSEWNGPYRDVVRRFIKGNSGQVGMFASVLSGSQTIYGSSKTPLSSVNFITAHDGFTLRDLVSYQDKHNMENRENNNDGNNQNDSWNCGVEGPTDDSTINSLRERQMRNFFLALFLSQGIPMLLMGDENGQTRNGNNNPYVQDNELNWMLWDKQDHKINRFVSSLIKFREDHPELKRNRFLTDDDVQWFNSWDPNTHQLEFMLNSTPPIYIAFNASSKSHTITLPPGHWQTIVNTSEDWVVYKEGPPLTSLELAPYSAILAMMKHLP